jgi:hypothetical protein
MVASTYRLTIICTKISCTVAVLQRSSAAQGGKGAFCGAAAALVELARLVQYALQLEK